MNLTERNGGEQANAVTLAGPEHFTKIVRCAFEESAYVV